MIVNLLKNPIAKKRYLYFKEMKRAYISLWLLVILYLVSLCSEVICNNTPLYISFNNKSYFPIFKFYPDDLFTGSGNNTRPDYHKINDLSIFSDNPDNYMIFPVIPYNPYESIEPESIKVSENVTVIIKSVPMMGTVNIRNDYTITRSARFGPFIGKKDKETKGLKITDFFTLSQDFKHAVDMRFANKDATSISVTSKQTNDTDTITSLSSFTTRKRTPKTVRVTFKEISLKDQTITKLEFDKGLGLVNKLNEKNIDIWHTLLEEDRKEILNRVENRFWGPVDNYTVKITKQNFSVIFSKQDVRFPYPPVKGHILGIDGAGRDVLARILYGLRISMTFGFLLVFCSMILGIMAGALQGYYGGMLDITGQRLIEIWSALPFLYIMILMGSVYGRSFYLLLFCYGIFNWIGISYYIRAEFLRLRKQPFVEAAKCMGIPSSKIIFKHILPNGLIPVITFFPFSLVGAIGSLAALDYLGFGLPPPVASWGELLFQAQQYRWAWWLILYPSLALFIVMLLGVFVGEGIRNAYDPKRYTRFEG